MAAVAADAGRPLVGVVPAGTGNRFARDLGPALRWTTGSSPGTVREHVDPVRCAVAGHSMGGGGMQEALTMDPTLKAGVPLAPWGRNTNWSAAGGPVAIVGGQAGRVNEAVPGR